MANNILIYELYVMDSRLTIMCGVADGIFFIQSLYNGDFYQRTFLASECRVFKTGFQALDNLCFYNRLKLRVGNKYPIDCDLTIAEIVGGSKRKGLAALLPRRSRVEMVSQVSAFCGKVAVNGKEMELSSCGYIHRAMSSIFPDRFLAINGMDDDISLAAYTSDNYFFKYAFNAFFVSFYVKGKTYKFTDFNFSSMSAVDHGTFVAVQLSKEDTILYIRASLSAEQTIPLGTRKIRADNMSKAFVILKEGDEIIYQGNIAATVVAYGNIKVGLAEPQIAYNLRTIN